MSDNDFYGLSKNNDLALDRYSESLLGFVDMKKRRTRIYPDLKTYFAESGDTQTAFAKRYRRTDGWVSQVVNGRLEPALKVALRISRETGVPLESLACRPDICAEAS